MLYYVIDIYIYTYIYAHICVNNHNKKQRHFGAHFATQDTWAVVRLVGVRANHANIAQLSNLVFFITNVGESLLSVGWSVASVARWDVTPCPLWSLPSLQLSTRRVDHPMDPKTFFSDWMGTRVHCNRGLTSNDPWKPPSIPGILSDTLATTECNQREILLVLVLKLVDLPPNLWACWIQLNM